MRKLTSNQQFCLCIVIGKATLSLYPFHWVLLPKARIDSTKDNDFIGLGHPGIIEPRSTITKYTLDWLCFSLANAVSITRITDVGIIYPANYNFTKEPPELVEQRYDNLVKTGWFN